MTELLKDTLTERATAADPPDLDLDAVMAAGNRHLRRRRAGALLGTALVTLAVIAASVTVPLFGDSAEPAGPPPIPFTERRPTYALDGVIHFGATTITTGSPVTRLIQTDVGFVFTDDAGTVKLADGRTIRTLAERGNQTALYAEGSVAAWEEKTDGAYRTIVKNLRTGDELLRIDHGDGSTDPHLPATSGLGRLLALDGGFAYFSVAEGLYQIDLDTHSGRVITASKPTVKPVKVQRGRYIYLVNGPEGIGHFIFVGPSLDQSRGRALQAHSGLRVTAEVSPEGSFLVTGEQDGLPSGVIDFGVYDGQGRARLSVKSGPQPQIFGQWLTDSTYTTIPIRSGQPLTMLTCTLRTRLTPIPCTVAASIAPAPTLQSLVVPDGRSLKDG